MRTQGQSSAITPSIAESLHERFSRLHKRLRSIELPHGMTQERMSALAIIDARGPISVSALADYERVRPATMSRMISALEADGLVKRLTNKSDGRGVLVASTARGRKVYARAQQQRLNQLSAALSQLPDDQLKLIQELTSALEKLTQMLETPKSR